MMNLKGFVILMCTCISFVKLNYIETKTNIGIIYGLLEDVEVFGKNFLISKYFGIPYAKPPIGDLRFMKPVPTAKLVEPLYATDHRDACFQYNVGLQPKGNISYSEDCLYLNIYAPVIKGEKAEKLAVMIWIHGGGFVVGSADPYLGDHLAAFGRVIVVTINYRLSLWGFFSSGDDIVPGNSGLWDQHTAIKWVHENIEAFGGDPEKITLFGESSGAGSVMLQGLYSGNKGFIHRMIAQSGSVGSWWSTDTIDKRKESTSKLIKLTGCEVTPTKSMVKCLQSIPGQKLLDIIENRENGFKALPVPFIPMVDNDFIKVSKENIFRADSAFPKEDSDFFLSLDLMMGMNNGDGSGAIGPLYGFKDPETFLPNRTTFERNPNLPDEEGLDWLKYTKIHQHYLQISRDMTSSNVKQRLNARRANFWAHFIPELVKSANCVLTKGLGSKTNSCQRDEPCPP
ncbi:cholinesterase-like isoform X2 [Mercenaria mercenaria]|uniref:cholinesterase-like isoform X2 n=1 Tax=Mercenaria mercenaria TaxID=6596 RepID=UPI00234E421A|nr:cholinesterase-like isoform X2 [Mercenaria mercenaria]